MPIETYNPDILERCSDILKQQLTKTIYPECDLIYARKSGSGSGSSGKKSSKSKVKKEANGSDEEFVTSKANKQKDKEKENQEVFISSAERYSGKRSNWKGPNYKKINKLYNGCCEIFDQLALILQKPIVFSQESFIIKVTSISLSVYFVENIPELQYGGLMVCTSLYKGSSNDMKSCLLDDMFVQLSHLPQSKKTKRQFKLRKYGKVVDRNLS